MKNLIVIYSLMMIIMAGAAFAAPADVPRTGQNTNHASGDDGDLKRGVLWPASRFAANADTTITDNLTGLVWAPDGNAMPSRSADWDQDGTANDGRVTWQHALDYVTKLNAESYLGNTDWRLPNVNELESLVHAEFTREMCGNSLCATNAAWLNTQGFSNVQANGYWSSSTSAADTSVAWSVFMNSGWMGAHSEPFGLYVWPVRGGQ